MFAPPVAKPQAAPPASRVLQRKCACGTHLPGGGSCARCAGKESGLRRKLAIGPSNDPLEHEADRVADQVLAKRAPSDFSAVPIGIQRRTGEGAGDAQPVPASVDRVLTAPGRPLDPPLRREMEARFGHDFSQVRIHQGAAAEQSARDVAAQAYTVGQDIVFGAGRFATGAGDDRRLLAHELVHVVQQASAPAFGGNRPPVADDGLSGTGGGVSGAGMRADGSGPAALLQRQSEPSAAKEATSPPNNADGIEVMCGPDVTKPVADACDHTRSTFHGWHKLVKTESCLALTSYFTGGNAWDIRELHEQDWITDFDTCSTYHCYNTVEVNDKCYYAGSVNYVIYGVMFKLCNSFFSSLKAAEWESYASQFTGGEMLEWIDLYKGFGITGFAKPSANYEPSMSWAYAGYHGWPAAATPAADRPSCPASCSEPYSLGPMKVHWHPRDDF